MKILENNKKAYHDYFIEDTVEAGIELQGWEVKSARAGNVNLTDSFISFSPVPMLKNAHFSPYEYGRTDEQEVRRNRRLLLNEHQISKFANAVKTKGFTCVATKIYLTPRGLVKVEIALAKGKHTYDKKQVLKEKDLKREAERAVKA